MTTQTDVLGPKLAEAAMTVLVRACRSEFAAASRDDLEAACSAMRVKAPGIVDRLVDEVNAAPWIAEHAFAAAALDLAEAGIEVLRSAERLRCLTPDDMAKDIQTLAAGLPLVGQKNLFGELITARDTQAALERLAALAEHYARLLAADDKPLPKDGYDVAEVLGSIKADLDAGDAARATAAVDAGITWALTKAPDTEREAFIEVKHVADTKRDWP